MALLALLAKGSLSAIISPFFDEAREVALNTAQDAIRSRIAGRMSVDEWAESIIESIDRIKDRVIAEEDLRYIGGKLKFTLSADAPDTVTISFQLYFQDDLDRWRKAEDKCDVPASKFTGEVLNELDQEGEIVYDVE